MRTLGDVAAAAGGRCPAGRRNFARCRSRRAGVSRRRVERERRQREEHQAGDQRRACPATRYSPQQLPPPALSPEVGAGGGGPGGYLFQGSGTYSRIGFFTSAHDVPLEDVDRHGRIQLEEVAARGDLHLVDGVLPEELAREAHRLVPGHLHVAVVQDEGVEADRQVVRQPVAAVRVAVGAVDRQVVRRAVRADPVVEIVVPVLPRHHEVAGDETVGREVAGAELVVIDDPHPLAVDQLPLDQRPDRVEAGAIQTGPETTWRITRGPMSEPL